MRKSSQAEGAPDTLAQRWPMRCWPCRRNQAPESSGRGQGGRHPCCSGGSGVGSVLGEVPGGSPSREQCTAVASLGPPGATRGHRGPSTPAPGWRKPPALHRPASPCGCPCAFQPGRCPFLNSSFATEWHTAAVTQGTVPSCFLAGRRAPRRARGFAWHPTDPGSLCPRSSRLGLRHLLPGDS